MDLREGLLRLSRRRLLIWNEDRQRILDQMRVKEIRQKEHKCRQAEKTGSSGYRLAEPALITIAFCFYIAHHNP